MKKRTYARSLLSATLVAMALAAPLAYPAVSLADELAAHEPEVAGLATSELEAQSTIVHEGTSGDVTWTIDSDGTLTLGAGTLSQTDWGWSTYAESVTKVVLSGDVVAPDNLSSLLEDMPNLREADLSGLDTSEVDGLWGMFAGLEQLETADLSGWDVSRVTETGNLFDGCTALRSVNLDGWNPASVENIDNMFKGCSSLTELDLSGWDMPLLVSACNTFEGCSQLTALNVSGWHVPNLKYLRFTFMDCSKVGELDVSGWNSQALANLSGTFYGCSALTHLDVSGWDTSQVFTLNSLFNGCSSLTSLDLSRWDTGAVTNMDDLFNGCASIVSTGSSNWNTSHVERMNRMFNGCAALGTFEGESWDVSSVTMMWDMLSGCSALTDLDLSAWDVSKLEYVNGLFEGCSSLASIDLSGWVLSGLSASGAGPMFDGCTSLAQWKVGTGYKFPFFGFSLDRSCTIPPATSSTGKWWSLAEQRWYSYDELAELRSGVADTYVNVGAATDISAASIALNYVGTYTGKEHAPIPSISYDGQSLRKDKDFKLTYANNVGVSTKAVVKIAGMGDYTGEVVKYFTIDRATNKMTAKAKAKKVSVKLAKVKKAKVTLKSNIVVSNPTKGKLTYKNVSSKAKAKKFKVSAKGKLTIPKGTKKGTYTVKIKVTSAQTTNYKASSKTVTFKVIVR